MPTKPKEMLRVRLQPGLLARLEKSREREGRTLTGEIVHRLERSFHKDEQDEGAALVNILRGLIGDAVAKMPPSPPPSEGEFAILRALEQMGKISVQDVGQAMAMVSLSKVKEGAES